MKILKHNKAVGLVLAALCCAITCTTTSCKRANATSSSNNVSVEKKAPYTASSQEVKDNTTAQAPLAGDSSIPKGARILMSVYPNFVKGYKNGKLVMSDGSTITYDDGRKKSFIQLLDEADPEDMFAFNYDLKSWTPAKMQDAGRSRCEELFKKMYGNSSSAVQKKLVPVRWPFGQATNNGGVNKNIKTVKFTSVNGANKQLEKVVAELEKHPELHKYLAQSGAFYWRPVRGAKRLSAHSYGMTIDIGVKFSDYWRSQAKDENATVAYRNKYPHEIVEIFEKYGFIWGGRWYHYDTMHFEYRPEILMDARSK